MMNVYQTLLNDSVSGCVARLPDKPPKDNGPTQALARESLRQSTDQHGLIILDLNSTRYFITFKRGHHELSRRQLVHPVYLVRQYHFAALYEPIHE